MIHITGAYNRYHVDEGNEIYNAVVLASRERVKAVLLPHLSLRFYSFYVILSDLGLTWLHRRTVRIWARSEK
ncbi:MAG: hypothetical protein ACJAXN_002872 [Psychromonas sp.]|jgi:hypothetical protein